MTQTDTSQKRKETIRELMGRPRRRMLDVGCGPIGAAYPYFDCADEIVCIDFALRVHDDLPGHVTAVDGDFTAHDFGPGSFDLIVCADVFEHIPIEGEATFVARCAELLAPDGVLIVSVPHKGRYAWMDPYEIKPFVQRQLRRLGLYSKLHNGTCDIRKGHKHYRADELAGIFDAFRVRDIRRYGYFYEPLGAWIASLSKRLWIPAALDHWVARRVDAENGQAWDETQAYSMAIAFEPAQAR